MKARANGHAAPKRRPAPLLRSGEKRDPLGSRLAPHIKQGLRMRAIREGRSMSWLTEEALVEKLSLRVSYVERKGDE